MRGTLERTRDLIASGIAAHYGDAGLVEPLAHVAAVEQLRHRYRPDGPVRLLLVAESHVRTADAAFAATGVQFIYEHRYYTPWWHDLILPAFGATAEATTAASRLAHLARLREAGFWLLDASVIALSGYKNVGATGSRPFEARRANILAISWSGHVSALFRTVRAQPEPPVVVAFENVAAVLPAAVRDRATRLKFKGQSNTKVYRTPAYRHGTVAFADAARRAGLQDCLHDIA